MNIIITMGGNGRRFREKGYNVPKYMIEVKNKTLKENKNVQLIVAKHKRRIIFACEQQTIFYFKEELKVGIAHLF